MKEDIIITATKIKEHLSKNRLKEAISLIQNSGGLGNEWKNNGTILSRRYSELFKIDIQDSNSFNETSKNKNKLTKNILDFLDDYLESHGMLEKANIDSIFDYKIYQNRSERSQLIFKDASLFNYVRDAKYEIGIISSTLNHYICHFGLADNLGRLVERKKVKVNIFILNPEAEFINYMSNYYDSKPHPFSNKIIESKDILEEVKSKLGENKNRWTSSPLETPR